MTSTQVPRCSAGIVRPPIRFIGLGETYEAISKEDESEFLYLWRGNEWYRCTSLGPSYEIRIGFYVFQSSLGSCKGA